MRSPSGFTLIEIMIVMAVIGILAAIAIPQFASYRQTAQDGSAKSALHQLAKAQEDYYSQRNTYALSRANLTNVSGWTVESTVTVAVLAASISSWSATARHNASPRIWTYDSARGGIQP
ncbi:MAG: prepilin-type N-terminal cleavage/methylation domain-containing protein [Deltaproteobacteria bacterium]|nr:prepilin-type N-terminal cleavage/methylation domain-containing protein [Deltaproteobacteria bacterium]